MMIVQLQRIFSPFTPADKTLPPTVQTPSPLPNSAEDQKEKETETHIAVRLPELFVLFLSGTPDVNPYYDEIKLDSERWLARKCHFNERAQRRLSKTDFSYFCSVSVSRAGREELRTVCDWGNWVFPFDDMFDNGKLRDDPTRAQVVVDDLLAGMGIGTAGGSIGSPERADEPLIEVHNSVWRRIVQTTSPGTQQRFAKSMHDYCLGSIAQVRNASAKTCPSIDEMLALRRQSAGVAPLFALVEYAHKLDIPDHVFECRSIKEIQRIGVDFVLIQNDILSYCKEETESVPHNLVSIARHSGLAAQPAFNRISSMLTARYRDWYLALAELPSFGETVDDQVMSYVEGVRAVVRANLGWSFRSKRYFGENGGEIRRDGVVRVRRDLRGYDTVIDSNTE